MTRTCDSEPCSPLVAWEYERKVYSNHRQLWSWKKACSGYYSSETVVLCDSAWYCCEKTSWKFQFTTYSSSLWWLHFSFIGVEEETVTCERPSFQSCKLHCPSTLRVHWNPQGPSLRIVPPCECWLRYLAFRADSTVYSIERLSSPEGWGDDFSSREG